MTPSMKITHFRKGINYILYLEYLLLIYNCFKQPIVISS